MSKREATQRQLKVAEFDLSFTCSSHVFFSEPNLKFKGTYLDGHHD